MRASTISMNAPWGVSVFKAGDVGQVQVKA